MIKAQYGCIILDQDDNFVKETKNLGWILNHYYEVDRIRVRPVTVYDTPDTYYDAVAIFYLKNDYKYVTPFADRRVLDDWLNRPKFQGIPLDWFGHKSCCGGIIHALPHIFDYKKVWK